jgi:hypothetical protein
MFIIIAIYSSCWNINFVLMRVKVQASNILSQDVINNNKVTI